MSNDGRAGIGVVWQYQIAAEWASFRADANVFVHKAYTEFLAGGLAKVEIVFGGTSRVIDFRRKVQTNKVTGTQREIRMSLDAPLAWTTSPDELLQQGASTRPMYVEIATKYRTWSAKHHTATAALETEEEDIIMTLCHSTTIMLVVLAH